MTRRRSTVMGFGFGGFTGFGSGGLPKRRCGCTSRAGAASLPQTWCRLLAVRRRTPSTVRPAAISDTATALTTTAMYPNNDTLGERLRLYVEENFHNV
jgi:hypothetical protein